MGGRSSCQSGCIGYSFDTSVAFPSVIQISDYARMEASLQKQFEMASKVSAVPIKAIPYVGPTIAAMLPVLVSLSFSGVKRALVKAEIREEITDNELKNIASELEVIRRKLEWVQLQSSSEILNFVTQTELIYVQSRLETLFEKFRRKDHILRKYPLVTLPQFAQISGILWSTTKLISGIFPIKQNYNNKLQVDMEETINQMCREFLNERLKSVHSALCSTSWTYRSQCVTEDLPWNDVPFKGSFTRATFKLGQQDRCRTSRFEDLPCHSSSASYVRGLIEAYESKFNKLFPVSPKPVSASWYPNDRKYLLN